MSTASPEHVKSKRGFASMPLEKRRAIASKGGKSIPAERRTFAKHRDLASEAGRRGGLASSRHKSHKPEEVYSG